jgi:hypothetical protein
MLMTIEQRRAATNASTLSRGGNLASVNPSESASETSARRSRSTALMTRLNSPSVRIRAGSEMASAIGLI